MAILSSGSLCGAEWVLGIGSSPNTWEPNRSKKKGAAGEHGQGYKSATEEILISSHNHRSSRTPSSESLFFKGEANTRIGCQNPLLGIELSSSTCIMARLSFSFLSSSPLPPEGTSLEVSLSHLMPIKDRNTSYRRHASDS